MNKPITFNKQEDNKAKIINVRVLENQSGVFYIPIEMLKSVTFKDAAIKLYDGVSNLSDITNRKLDDLTLNGWLQEAPKVVSETVVDPFRNMVKVGVDRIINMKQRRNEWLTTLKVDTYKSAEIRQYIRSMKGSGAAAYVLSSPEASVAALEAWDMTGLPDNLRNTVEKTLLLNNLTEIYKAYSQVKPTLKDPLAHGADIEDAKLKASAALTSYENDMSEIEIVRSILTNTVKFVAAVTVTTEDIAYAALVEKK